MEKNLNLTQLVNDCRKCRLGNLRQNAVPAEPGIDYQKQGLAIFAEAPGKDEDVQGTPMVGRAGRLLNGLLEQAGSNRVCVLVLNRVRCQPLRNRLQDYPDALINCDEWTRAELEYYDPKVVILAGNTAMRAVFGVTANITAMRGKVRATSEDYQYGKRIWIPTWHPAAILRNPELTQDTISDIKLAVSFL